MIKNLIWGEDFNADFKFPLTFEEALNKINEVINTFGSKEKAVEELTNQANMYIVDKNIVQQIKETVDGILKIEEGYTKIEGEKKELGTQKQNFNTAKETYNSGLQQYNSGYAKYEKNNGYSSFWNSIIYVTIEL